MGDTGVGRAGRAAQDYAGRLRARYRRGEGRGGDALPSDVRSRLAPHLGFDPGLARLHTGPEADAAARALRAEAFTIGRHVFFAEGRLDTASTRGMRLLTHELAHVGQQSLQGAHPAVSRQTSEPGIESPASGDLQMHREKHEVAPSSRFALPLAQPAAATMPAPSQTATQEQGAAAGPARAGAPAKADAQLVADRVYELMRQEILVGRERGAVRRRRR